MNPRDAIRTVIQILVQFVVPGAIIIFFVNEALAKYRRRRGSDGEVQD